MNKKALGIIVGGLILLALIVYFIFFHDFNATDEPVTDTTGGQQQAEEVITTTSPEPIPNAPERSAAEVSRDQASQLAIFFAERYGTSSSQADFGNLEDLDLFTTDAMATRLDQYIAAEREKISSAQAYSAITTKAIVAEFSAFSEIGGSATGVVKTKRREVSAEGESREYSQDLNIGLKKVNGEWKVDSAVWVE